MENRTNHLTSEQKRKYAKAVSSFREIFAEQVCMRRGEDCSTTIVRSHTVSRSEYLTRIAEDSHVLQWTHSPWSSEQAGVIDLKPAGVNLASTFNGFCTDHDTRLFGEIDNGPFLARPSQVFQQVFRAHSREVYCKRAQILAFPDPKNIADFYDLENPEDYGLSDQATLQMLAMNTGLRDCLLHHERLESVLKFGDFRRLCSCVIPLTGEPVISVSGSFFPDFDTIGNSLQDFTDLETPLNTIHFNVLPTTTGCFAIFSFLDIESGGPEQFVRSVIESDRITDLLIWIAFTYIENVQVRPSWWRDLDASQKESIKEAFRYNIDLMDPRVLTVSKCPSHKFTVMSAQRPFWI